MALLAKQGWRFIQNPSSLVAKIFREKYFRSSSFLEAKLGHCPSLIWRSVWKAADLLRKGLRWRVGDGKNIKIWGQRWVPIPSTFCIQSPVSLLDKEAKVCELMKGNGEWDDLLIKRIFNKEEAEVISSIPLSRMVVEDKIVWSYDEKGQFSVKSAYILEFDSKRAKEQREVKLQGEEKWIEGGKTCGI